MFPVRITGLKTREKGDALVAKHARRAGITTVNTEAVLHLVVAAITKSTESLDGIFFSSRGGLYVLHAAAASDMSPISLARFLLT